MRVILLCAGYATRLYPLTENQPKPLLPIGGRPILEWILERIAEIGGVEDVTLVSNHRFAGHFESWAAERSKQFPWPVHIVDDHTTSNEDRLGAIGDLRFVLKERGIGAEDLLVIAGDNLFDFDLTVLVRDALARRPYPLIAIYDVADRELARRYGLVRLDRENQVLEFFEKPQDPPTTLASCGIYWLPCETRDLLDRYIREGHNSDQPGHYMKWLAQADRLYAVLLEGYWFDIGDLTSYQKADALSSQFRKLPRQQNH